MKIDMSFGSGGRQTSQFIHDIFLKHFNNEIIAKMEDSAVLRVNGNIAFTTDSFVVTPLFFDGGDIGKVAVCGTVNDLLMMGARPKYLTTGFIIEEGTDIETIDQIASSMAAAAAEAKVQIVAGDTKVIEGSGGVYINTSGIGEIIKPGISISNCKEGDIIILSGNLGEHHSAIMSHRMGISNQIKSDCAPLLSMVTNLIEQGIDIHAMRDVTRGGLATVLNEICESSKCMVEIKEADLPVSREIKGFCEILGLDPLYMANEGKMIAVLPESQGDRALKIIQSSTYGENAKIIGRISKGEKCIMTTALEGKRIIDTLYGEGLPRIC